MRSPLFILIAAFLVSLLVAQFAGGIPAMAGTTSTGSDLLLLMLRHDPHLAPALASADNGDGAPLLAWLNAADARSRQNLAVVTKLVAMQHDGLSALDDSTASDRALHRYRQRLTAFVNIPTGDPDVDAELDNLLAYILVAGVTQPSAADVALAQRLLPRLDKQMQHAPNAAVFDTIGCVHYVSGELAKAKAAFQQAVTLGERDLSKVDAKTKPNAERALALYRRRLQTAQEADLRAVEKRAATSTAGDLRPPLPLADEAPATPPQLPPTATPAH